MAYPISNTLKEYFLAGDKQIARITATLKNGTTKTLTSADIKQGTMVIDRSGISGTTLEIGSCIASELSFTLNNSDGSFDGVDWVGATLKAEVGVGSAYAPMGFYIIDEAPKWRAAMQVKALDRMVNFDQPVSNSALDAMWANGPTIAQVVSVCCSQAGVTLASNISSYPNASFKPEKPEGIQSLTYRQLLMYCCAIMGKCGYMDWEGNLRIEFPSKTVSSAVTITEAQRYTSEVEDYSISVTGIFYTTAENEMVICGSDDYAFDLSGNPFATESSIAALSGLIGLAYTPFSATTLPMPYLYPLDWVTFSKNGTSYYGILTNTTFVVNGTCTLTSVGDSPAEHARAATGASTATLIKHTSEIIKESIASALDISQENASELIKNAASGHIYIKYVDDADGHPVATEICIMDTDDPETATRVWRWNSGGFGYSSNGYNGDYNLAMTMDGAIVADFITAGTMSAERIRVSASQMLTDALEDLENLEIGGQNYIYNLKNLTADVDYSALSVSEYPNINGHDNDYGYVTTGDGCTLSSALHGVKATAGSAKPVSIQFGSTLIGEQLEWTDDITATDANNNGNLALASANVTFTDANSDGNIVISGGATSVTLGGLYGLTPGRMYTFSADAEVKLFSAASSGTYSVGAFLYTNADSSALYAVSAEKEILTYSSGYGAVRTARLEFTFTIPESATALYLQVRPSDMTASLFQTGDYIQLESVKLESGEKATAWSSSDEDTSEEISVIRSQQADMQLDYDGFKTHVSETYQTKSGMADYATTEYVDSQLTQTARDLTIEFNNKVIDSVSGESTDHTTSYKFDKDGLNISKNDSSIENTIDNTGMHVRTYGESVLEATDSGVEAMNLHSRQYLEIGLHARFQDYATASDPNRTACYYRG